MTKALEIGARLKAIRLHRGERQAVVAEAVGMARPSLSMLENGHDSPGLDLIVALADYYGVSLDHLVRGTPLAGLDATFDPSQKEEEGIVLRLWRRLKPDQKEVVALTMNALLRPEDRASLPHQNTPARVNET